VRAVSSSTPDLRDLAREVLTGEEVYLVGGAVRDELLGRELVDLDIVCSDPKKAARLFAKESGGAPFPLSERHGAWRVTFVGGECVDFTPLRGTLAEDLALRDFTVNAIAEPLAGGEVVDPFDGRRDLAERRLRVVSERVFDDDPLRLLRAVRLEQELGLALDRESEELVRSHAGLVSSPAGERILAELEKLAWSGYERLEELGLLAPLDGSLALADRVERALVDTSWLRLVTVFGEHLQRFPISNELDRYSGKLLRAQPPADDSPRQIHRFRRATEPWALDALAFLGAAEYAAAVRLARETEPDEPLLRGDQLGVPPNPLVGELLELIAEERAAGTISTREEALELVRRRLQER
jgi:tRNA nucleotidyltransferase/poly(A) polymerase